VSPSRHPIAWWQVGGVAGLVGVVLLAFSGRYGYHRDELYFLEAGRHLDWGYPDQPPLVPLLARAMSSIAPDSLVVLRLPSTLAATGVVLLAGLMARELGARATGQVTAAAATGLCGFVLGTGHLLSTSTFSLLGWSVLTYLLTRLLAERASFRSWVVAGVVAGVTLQANVLAFAFLGAFGIAVLLVGPRRMFRDPGPYAAITVALVLVAPYVVWQASHGFPQLDVARSIASGGSGSSASRVALVPLLLLQAGPALVWIWLPGLLRLCRDPALRSLGATYLVLLVLFLGAGGKPYYLAGMYPLLFAAGAQPVVDRARRWVVPALLALSTPVLVFVLPVLPTRHVGPILAVNYDAGETFGWPAYVDQVAAAYRTLPPGTAILAGNYGEAGAVDRYGPVRGLPSAYSGHNAYERWGPPPGSTPVLAIGIDPALLRSACTAPRGLGTLHEVHGIDNDEDGADLAFCAPRRSWDRLWPRFVHLG
jgi:hypothetical protein